VDGKDLKELAAERQTSVNTVRNQVSSLLDKTSTSSQRELIGLFAGTRRI
jgi:DNA-binding CsgD family transcriptional regulator